MYIDTILAFIDYINRYCMLKTARTIIVSSLVILLLLLVRKAVDIRNRKKNVMSGLYLKAYMWLLLLPVPFMGRLKLSMGHPSIRNRLYVRLYQFCMDNSIVAEMYAAGILVVAMILIFRKVRLRLWIRRLPSYEYVPADGGLEKRMTAVKVRVTPFKITPFTTGIVRPVIVLPEYILNEFDEKERDTIIQHEYCHIRRGHLVIYAVLDVLRIVWFVNPLVHYSARLIRNDLEMICDHASIRTNTYNPEGYAKTLLKSLAFLQEASGSRESRKGVPALVSETSYQVMKRRIQSIACYQEYSRRYFRTVYILAGVGLCLLTFFVRIGSYPAYTPFEGCSFYCGARGRQLILDDDEELAKAVQVTDQGFVVDNRKVKEILKDIHLYNDTGEYWIYAGGYMKLPGIGGGGEAMFYTSEDMLKDEVLLPYSEKNKWMDWLEWILKHV